MSNCLSNDEIDRVARYQFRPGNYANLPGCLTSLIKHSDECPNCRAKVDEKKTYFAEIVTRLELIANQESED